MATLWGRSAILSGAALIAVVLTGCASSGSPGAASPTVPTVSTVSTVSTAISTPADDWAALQAAVAEADAQLASATSQGWWSGPVCNPDIELHRENSGQDPLSDQELRDRCAANIAEFWASKDDYDQLQALDESARAVELARIGAVLDLPADQEPKVSQAVVVHGCEQGWITDPADCAGIPAG